MKIKSKLRLLRDSKGLTQVEIALKAGISTLSYQRYEAGERVPNVHTAQLIAQALHTTVEEIFPIQEQDTTKRDRPQ